MTFEPDDPRQALERVRDRLDAILGRSYAWRALRRLEQREAEGRAGPPGEVRALRARIKTALAGNRVYQARQKLSEAIALLAGPPAMASAPAVAVVSAAAPPPIVVTPTSPADDLTRIRGIDRALAARLDAIGVDSFDAIAGWRAADVRRVSEALGLERRIHRQNWIEQAALFVARRRPEAAAPPPPASSQPVAEPPARAIFVPVPARPSADLVAAAVLKILAKASLVQTSLVQTSVAQTSVAQLSSVQLPPPASPPPLFETTPIAPFSVAPVASAADDLTAIRGLDARSAAALATEGVATFAAIARWSADDVARMRAVLGSGAAMIRKQWVEQAAMLAAGHSTRHARTHAQWSPIPLAPRPAATATARDEGFACALRRMHATVPALQAAVVASAPGPAPSQPSSAPSPDFAGTWDDEIALTGLVDFAAVADTAVAASSTAAAPSTPAPPADLPLADPSPDGEAITAAAPARELSVASPALLAVVVLPPKPIAATLAASVPLALTPHSLPPLLLQLLPETSAPSPSATSSDAAAPLIDYDSDSLLDIAATNFVEADVRIVPALAADAELDDDTDELAGPRSFAIGGGAGTLQSRLRKASDNGDEIDSRNYAAYRSVVEEAAVEIVHRDAATRDQAAAGPGLQSARGNGGPTTVRRFLKALTGQER